MNLSAQILALRREVSRTKARWHSLSADVPDDIETLARDDYWNAQVRYLTALENYFAETERALGRTGT